MWTGGTLHLQLAGKLTDQAPQECNSARIGSSWRPLRRPKGLRGRLIVGYKATTEHLMIERQATNP